MFCDSKSNETLPPYPIYISVPLTIFVGLLILLILFGNVLVIIAVFTSRALKAPQNLFLVSLASADILVATLVMPFSLAYELMGIWYFGKVWCKFYQALDVLFCTASIAHLCAISLDRYWSITKAIQYNLKRTPRRIKCIIFIVWIISIVICFPALIMDTSDSDGLQCAINQEKWYMISSSIGSFFVPCTIMIPVYVRIYQIAKKRTRVPRGKGKRIEVDHKQDEPGVGHSNEKLKEMEGDERNDKGEMNGIDMEESSSSDHNVKNPCSPKAAKGKKQSRIKPGDDDAAIRVDRQTTNGSRWKGRQNREKRFTFVLAVVVGVFVICWFPFFFTYTLLAICTSCCVPEKLFKFFFWFGYCNSSLNPIIYTIFNNDFRRSFKKILCKGERRQIV